MLVDFTLRTQKHEILRKTKCDFGAAFFVFTRKTEEFKNRYFYLWTSRQVVGSSSFSCITSSFYSKDLVCLFAGSDVVLRCGGFRRESPVCGQAGVVGEELLT